METGLIVHYSSSIHHPSSDRFEEAFHHSQLRYSLRYLAMIGNVSTENITEALQKSLNVCRLAGINSRHHFKKNYVFDATAEVMHVDWLMSKTGFNLMVVHIPLVNERLALWLWELAHS